MLAAELDAFGTPVGQNGYALDAPQANGPVLSAPDAAPPSVPPGRPRSAMSSAASMQPAAMLAGMSMGACGRAGLAGILS